MRDLKLTEFRALPWSADESGRLAQVVREGVLGGEDLLPAQISTVR